MLNLPLQKTSVLALCLLCFALLGACSEASAPTPDDAVAHVDLGGVHVADPEDPLTLMEQVEDSSEAVANRFVEFAYELKRRDFGKAAEWISDDFRGQVFFGDLTGDSSDLPLGVTREVFDVAAVPTANKSDWMAAIKAGLGPWERVDAVVVKVKGAEFTKRRPLWGKVRFKWSFFGQDQGGAKRTVVAWTWGRVEKRRGRWMLTEIELIDLSREGRDTALFCEVSTTVGLAKSGVRFGKPGNTSFAWNGVAAGDVNGDGLVDLYVPEEGGNDLYIAQASGGFREQSAAWGVRFPDGGTSSVFVDFDNDGDLDLFCADEGWQGKGDDSLGNPLRLLVNSGSRFVERGEQLGFTGLVPAYSLAVLDFDNDGFMDVYVCNYGVQKKEGNNDWLNATNGGANMLFRNLGGKRFEDVAAQAGVADGRWSYAAAAADFDRDGDMDLYVANDYGTNAMFVNQGNGTFEDRAVALGVEDRGNGMGTMWGDFNSDGQLDLYVANMSSTAGNRILSRMADQSADAVSGLRKMAAGNSIFLGGPKGSFTRQAAKSGGIGASWAWCPLAFDMDLDGNLDLYNCSGYVSGDSAADT